MFEKIRDWRRKRHEESVKKRAEEVFSIEEYKGQLWLFCNNTGICPCSFVNLKTEDEMVKFLSQLRMFYIETEM